MTCRQTASVGVHLTRALLCMTCAWGDLCPAEPPVRPAFTRTRPKAPRVAAPLPPNVRHLCPEDSHGRRQGTAAQPTFPLRTRRSPRPDRHLDRRVGRDGL